MNNIQPDSVILITGSGGGLGNAVIKNLQKKGFKNLLAPSRNSLDLLNQDAVFDYFSEKRPQIVIHLASIVFGLLGNMENQMRSLIENTQINSNLFSAIDNFPVKNIFFAGTVAAYPYPYKQIPLQESDFFHGLPHSGEFGYAMSKRHAYAYLKLLAETKNIRYTYGIFTNLYGEYDRFDENNGHVIPSLVMKAYRSSHFKESFSVWGDGRAERDFLHFNDAAEAIFLCITKEKAESLINISSNVAISIRSVAELIAQEANISDITFLSDKPVGIPSRVVENSRLKSIGFSQTVSIEQGIKNLYNWYSRNITEVRK